MEKVFTTVFKLFEKLKHFSFTVLLGLKICWFDSGIVDLIID